MVLDMEMNIGQYQKVLLTPQLDYSLKILKLNNEELTELIDEEMLTNPLLEYKESGQTQGKSKIVDYNNGDERYKGGFDDEIDYINSIPDNLSITPSLVQHLMLQLHTQNNTKETTRICEYLIESIDEHGYLSIDPKETAKMFKVEKSKIEKGIEIIQGFDPPGIGAKDLKDCLKLQLIRKNISNPYLYELIETHLESVAANRLPQVAIAMGIEVAEINQLLETIKTLDPRPGSCFSSETTNYIKPDIIVTRNDDTFEVAINKEQIPAIQINNYYSDLLSKKSRLMNEEYNYINKHLHSATWLIRCIEQRLQTLERVAKAIVEHQMSFFCLGKQHLKPLTLKDIAFELDLHESTISRAVNSKYLLCQWGIFELKYFFSSKVIKKETGEDASSATAKYELIQLIKEEDKKNPLSDTALCEKLKEKSIDISRRTVAKYRAQLNIPAMNLRRKF